MSNGQQSYDAVIVGAGISGALIAKQLATQGKKVLIIESGASIPNNIESYMERFYLSSAKVPESPYTPVFVANQETGTLVDPKTVNAPRPNTLSLNAQNWQDPAQAYLIQQGPLPFSSTYERIAGGTMRHWLGTSLRFCPNDFRMKTEYGRLVDWPIGYDDLEPWYGRAESEIGVSADVGDQEYCGITFPKGYQYPMPPIPESLVDDAVAAAASQVQVDGITLNVANTPAGRNSVTGYQSRPACAGNTNCIPICPIRAKYDPSVTLADALQTGNVTILYRTVATHVVIGADNQVSAIDYVQYEQDNGPQTGSGSVSAKIFVLAAHAIETPKLLLMSTNGGRFPNGVANSSGQVGKNLMDHPLYLAWALSKPGSPVYGYRGPLATSGIEDARDGAFRTERAAFRIEIGNEGWNFSVGDPETTTVDFIDGRNESGLNPGYSMLYGQQLIDTLNGYFTRQFRLGFLMEQSPDDTNTVTLSTTYKDHLNLPRPEITYNLSEYTKKGFIAARQTASEIFAAMGATEYTAEPAPDDPSAFTVVINGQEVRLKFFGAGHVVGTYRMGSDPATSVVNAEQRSWDHPNLFLVGSGVFPTVATGNPTLTIAALTLMAADAMLTKDLAGEATPV